MFDEQEGMTSTERYPHTKNGDEHGGHGKEEPQRQASNEVNRAVTSSSNYGEEENGGYDREAKGHE